MNKIVKTGYPVSALPEDLRQNLDPCAQAIVTVETMTPTAQRSITEIFSARQTPGLSAQAIDGELRASRDAWCD